MYSRCMLMQGPSDLLCSSLDAERELRDSENSWNEARNAETRKNDDEHTQVRRSDSPLVTPNVSTSMETHSGEEAEEERTAAKAEQKGLLKVDQNMFFVCLNASFDRSY